MRLIDADAAYKAACEGADNWDGGCSPYRDDCIREEMDKVPTASPWHRVEEPPKGYGAFAACCVYDGKICWFKAIYLDGKWLREMDGVELPVNYWMEIPEPPKEAA